MHAYLIVGEDSEKVKAKSEEVAKKFKAKILEFPAEKIEDIRGLSSFTKFSFTKPTAIILYSIEVATEEALNALLKNLEESQENLFYILTAASVHKVLPTIVSRCQIIKVKSEKSKVKSEEIENFLEMSVGEKLAYVDKIKDRQIAISFVENLIAVYHQKLHENTGDYKKIVRNIDQINLTLNNLKVNGNVALQLANMVINGV